MSQPPSHDTAVVLSLLSQPPSHGSAVVLSLLSQPPSHDTAALLPADIKIVVIMVNCDQVVQFCFDHHVVVD